MINMLFGQWLEKVVDYLIHTMGYDTSVVDDISDEHWHSWYNAELSAEEIAEKPIFENTEDRYC